MDYRHIIRFYVIFDHRDAKAKEISIMKKCLNPFQSLFLFKEINLVYIIQLW